MLKNIMTLNLSLLMAFCISYTGCAQQNNEEQTYKQEDNLLRDLGMTGTDSNVIVFETNQGSIEIKLLPNVAPKAVENIKGLINQGYYNGIIFHRVIKNFMIQGGDPTGTGRGGTSLWGSTFEDEVSPSVQFDKKGLLAMANAGPNTNGSQFFITTTSTPHLNMKHTIFGEVISGYDVVEKIENAPTGARDRPLDDQVILKAFIK